MSTRTGRRNLLSNNTGEPIVIANGRHYTSQEWFDGVKRGDLDADTPHECLAPGTRFASKDEIDHHLSRIIAEESSLLDRLANI